ncbi:MAG: hypothetical protein ACRCX2_09525, partial [Paraclostridium sp.]
YLSNSSEFNNMYLIRKDTQSDLFINNYNFSTGNNFGYIIRLERDCSNSLKQEFFNILNNI